MSQKRRMEQSTTPEAMSADQLAPVREWAHANHGAIKRLAERISKLSGKPVNRHMVSRWLAMEKEKRIQPSHGYALLLERAMAELQAEDAAQQEQNRRIKPRN